MVNSGLQIKRGGVSSCVNASQYQRVRLWSGITSIGLNLAAIWLAVALAGAWGPGLSVGAQIAALLGLVVAFTLGSLPFDLLTGHALETFAGRTRQPLGGWLSDWAGGAARTGVGLAFGLGIFWANAATGGGAAGPLILGVLVLTVVAVGLVPGGRAAGPEERAFAARLEEERARLGLPAWPVRWFDAADDETVNGYVPPLRPARLCLSTSVARELTPREAALLAAREVWFRRSGASAAGATIVVAWQTIGVALALHVPANSPLAAAVAGAAVVSTWSFVALFVWPTLNRAWMRAADRSLRAFAPETEVRALLAKVQRLNATDVDLPPGKTAVFHPIPPLAERQQALL